MTVVLWHLQLSHYSEKVRWALDFKRIPHTRRLPMPGLHRVAALALTRGRHDRMPVVEIDGRRIGDSTAIIAALEEYAPSPPLYPDDAGERARALALEEFFDEQVAPEVRRWMWHHTMDDIELALDSLFPPDATLRRRVAALSAPASRLMLRLDYTIDEDSVSRAETRMRAAMDRLEREIGPSGYLVGDRFSVADLTAASLLTPLLAPPGRQYQPPRVAPAVAELRAEFDGRPGGRWVHEMYARHRLPAGADGAAVR